MKPLTDEEIASILESAEGVEAWAKDQPGLDGADNLEHANTLRRAVAEIRELRSEVRRMREAIKEHRRALVQRHGMCPASFDLILHAVLEEEPCPTEP